MDRLTETKTVELRAKCLRNKVGAVGYFADMIVTMRGYGYKFSTS